MSKENKKQKKEKKEKKELFITKVRKEMKKVRWPKKKEMIKYSFAVLLCIIILSLFFVATDLLITFIRTIIGGL